MAVSSDVVQNAQTLATDYNKLREDVLDNATGHEHTGGASAGKAVDHANLGNVLTDDHHAKYTDAEAKTQAEGAKLDDHAAPDDNTDVDAAAGQHGLMPKLDKIKLDASASAATASVLVIRDASSRSKFGAPGAAGDALIKGTRVTTAELPAMTDEKIWKGTGGNVEEIDVPISGVWALFETLSPSGVTTITSSALDVHDLWMVFIDLVTNDGAERQLQLNLNGDSGADYDKAYVDATSIINTGGSTYLTLGSGTSVYPLMGVIYVEGKSLGTGGEVQVVGGVGGGNTYNYQLHGHYNADADVTGMTFTLWAAGTITGKIKLYFMDY